jgi:hypothetical protein
MLRLVVFMGTALLAVTAPSSQWLTIGQLSDRLQVPVKTLRFWRAHGNGPPGTKFGSGRSAHLRYWLPDVEAWEQAEREQARVAS